MERIIDGETLNVPEHVAIILDGNGRWAKKRFMPRNYGHMQGAKTVEKMCEVARDLGIKYFTVYAFSTENWKRPQSEVDALMKLLRKYMVDSLERTAKNNMRVRVIGDKTGLSEDIQKSIADVETASAGNTGLNFTIAINYGSRDEMIRAMKKMLADGHTNPDEMSEALFEHYLDTGRHAGSGSGDSYKRRSSVFPIFCSGRWRILSSILHRFFGRIITKRQ